MRVRRRVVAWIVAAVVAAGVGSGEGQAAVTSEELADLRSKTDTAPERSSRALGEGWAAVEGCREAEYRQAVEAVRAVLRDLSPAADLFLFAGDDEAAQRLGDEARFLFFDLQEGLRKLEAGWRRRCGGGKGSEPVDTVELDLTPAPGGFVFKGGVRDGAGQPKPGAQFLFQPPPPTPEALLAGHDPVWRDRPVVFAESGADGRFSLDFPDPSPGAPSPGAGSGPPGRQSLDGVVVVLDGGESARVPARGGSFGLGSGTGPFAAGGPPAGEDRTATAEALVREAVRSPGPDATDALRDFVAAAAASGDADAVVAVINAPAWSVAGTLPEDLQALRAGLYELLRALRDPAGYARSRFLAAGREVEGDDYDGLHLTPRTREALAILRRARLAELLRSLAYLDTLKRGTGEVPAGGFLDLSPGSALAGLEAINRRRREVQEGFESGPATTGQVLDRELQRLDDLADLDRARDDFLATPGARDDAAFRAARAELLGQLREEARIIRSHFETFKASLLALRARDDQVPRGGSMPYFHGGGRERTPEYAAMVEARDAFLRSLDGRALLATEVSLDAGVAGTRSGPLWRVLLELFPTQTDTAQRAIDLALANLEEQIRSEIARIGDLWEADELVEELGSPLYAPLVRRLGEELGPLYGPLIAPMLGAVQGAWQAHEDQDELWDRITDTLLAGGQVGTASIMILFPASVPVLGPVQVALGAGQAGVEGERTVLAWSEKSTAEGALAAGGSVDHAAQTRLEEALSASIGHFLLASAVVPLDWVGYRWALAELRAAEAARAGEEAAEAAAEVALGGSRTVEAGSEAASSSRLAGALEEAADELVPAGRAPTLRRVDDAEGIVDRLDPAARQGRRGVYKDAKDRVFEFEPGDVDFLGDNRLLPERTVEHGGQTFHLSRPFRGPEDKVAVLAFQETADGTVMPRVLYLSNEHATWRAATAADSLLRKGPLKLVDAVTGEELATMGAGKMKTQFANESTVDVAGEVQGVLDRWVAERGVADDIAEEDAVRAFFGFLEEPQVMGVRRPGLRENELRTLVERADVELPFPRLGQELDEGLRPDLAAGPLDYSRVQGHPLYGDYEAFLYRSRDGSTLYRVVRTSDGRVFVPSVQDAATGITPWGTRFEVPLTDLNQTPLIHGKGAYVANPAFGRGDNPLVEAFRDGLPAPSSVSLPEPAVLPAAPGPFGGGSAGTGSGGSGVAGGGMEGAAAAPAATRVLEIDQTPRWVLRLGPSVGPFTFMTGPDVVGLWDRLERPFPVPGEAGGGSILPFRMDPAARERLEEQVPGGPLFYLEPDRGVEWDGDGSSYAIGRPEVSVLDKTPYSGSDPCDPAPSPSP